MTFLNLKETTTISCITYGGGNCNEYIILYSLVIVILQLHITKLYISFAFRRIFTETVSYYYCITVQL